MTPEERHALRVTMGYVRQTNPSPAVLRTVEQIEAEAAEPCEFPSWADERDDILTRFGAELAKATGDGSSKRQAGTKPPWHDDDSHAAAMYRHLERWEAGEKHDPDHEAHPLVAAAWRALAIACRESGNVPQ